MKILFAVRLFSGFQASIVSGEWNPTGAPTIYKLIEWFDRSTHKLDLVFTCKEDLLGIDTTSDRDLFIGGLESKIGLFAGQAAIPAWTGRFRWHILEFIQACKLLRRARTTKPDLIYIDRGNLWAASLLALYQKAPVVYRVMGISPGLREAQNGYRPRQILHRRLLKAPFDLVICSLDGSGGEIWLDQMLASGVARQHLLNGVDLPVKKATQDITFSRDDDTSTTVLFVGRLEKLKGCNEFLTAFLAARLQASDNLKAVIVGEGGKFSDLQMQVANAQAQGDVTFTGALKHSDVLHHYRKADIYVSLNRMGNLSNSNLEAMHAGCCVIFPAAQPKDGIDLKTDELFPNDTVYRIANADDVQGLANGILHLHKNRDESRARAKRTEEIAKQIIPSWQERISDEIRLLEQLANKGSIS